jgi:hypothetical protein
MLLRGRLRRLRLLLLRRRLRWHYLMLLRRWLTRPVRRFLFLLMFTLWRLRYHEHAIGRRGMDRSNDNS